jgi:hypothetical protein
LTPRANRERERAEREYEIKTLLFTREAKRERERAERFNEKKRKREHDAQRDIFFKRFLSCTREA